MAAAVYGQQTQNIVGGSGSIRAVPPDTDQFRSPKGIHDVLPPESGRWVDLVSRFAARAQNAGFGLVISPMFEHVEVFERVGEHTDVVSKEMYTLTDKGGRSLALRPEGTAGVVRAYVQHHPTPPWKVFYVAPNFRYERAQKGRYRQHWQVGVEVLGTDDSDADVEVIALLAGFYADLGLTGVRLLLNSMGDAESRPEYILALRSYLLAHVEGLGDDFRTRAEGNPLRVLDSKLEAWQDVIERAPQLTEYLSTESRDHFERVQEGLSALGVDYELMPRLVRGFDYYTSTTFEFQSMALDSAQNAIGGGGRYDGLAQQMGGDPTPGIGFGAGIERTLLAIDSQGDVAKSQKTLDAFVVDGCGPTRSTDVLVLVGTLRDAGLAVDRAFDGRSLKAQWKSADRSGARFGVMLGSDEASRDAVAVKDMETGEQVEVQRASLAVWLHDKRVNLSR